MVIRVRDSWFPLCLAFACFSAISQAQHVPEDQLTAGKPETVLSGINVYRTKLDQVIAMYGKPSSQDKDAHGLPLYIWQKSGVKLQVGTAYDDKDSVYSVHVWGAKPAGQLGRTGKGLKLGCDLACLKRLYGPKVIQHSPTEAMVAYSDETMLTVGFDERGRINHISLVGAVE
jgi:hypothetical protein